MMLPVVKDPADISNMELKSNKTIRMNNVRTIVSQPGLVFDKQKANAALLKAAYYV